MANDRIIQLATNLDKLSAKASKAAFANGGYASEKIDGVWVAAVCINGVVEFYSSTLEKYISLNGTDLEAEIRSLHIGSWMSFVLIAEAYTPDTAQAVISGNCRTETIGYAKDIELHVHDILTLEEWSHGKSDTPYEQRKTKLSNLVGTGRFVKRLEQYEISSPEALSEYALEVQRTGGEGVCYRPRLAGWLSGNRGTNLVRIKEKMTYDLEAIGVSGVQEGPNGGLLGVLQVKWREFGKVDGKESIQDIRGMTHDQLRAWNADPELIVGKIVEVEAMKFTAFGMLREPRFKVIREDKAVADL